METDRERKMEMKKNKGAFITEIILTVLCVLLCAGDKFIFHACVQTDEGKWMACHWAEQAVFAAGISLTVTALMLLLVRNDDIKRGLALAMIPQAAVTAFIPNTLINLCMKTDMRCHTVTKPTVIIISAAVAVCAVICAFMKRDNSK